MKKIEIIYEKPENLIPYVNNHKVHSDEQILRIASSIQEFGMDQPVVVDKNMVIIKGHGRREAALKLKLKTIPVIIADELDEYQVKAARIADNKSSSVEYDLDALKFDIGTLNLQGFNLASLGIQPLELDELMKELDQSNFENDFQEISDKVSQQQSEILPVVGVENENFYTDKIETPIYEPKGEKPFINDLIDLNKYKSLCQEIEQSNLSGEEKQFLMFAASRHIVFNYEKIANYYAHSGKTTQGLFENSALVIIDFDKAVENGFVKLSKEMNESYISNQEDDEQN